MTKKKNIATTGERIDDLMKDKKITQKAVSQATGISQATISALINGREMESDTLKKLCKYFNVSADYLLGLTDTPSRDPDIKMICNYTGLSEYALTVLRETSEVSYVGSESIYEKLLASKKIDESLTDYVLSKDTFTADNFKKTRNEFISSLTFLDIVDACIREKWYISKYITPVKEMVTSWKSGKDQYDEWFHNYYVSSEKMSETITEYKRVRDYCVYKAMDFVSQFLKKHTATDGDLDSLKSDFEEMSSQYSSQFEKELQSMNEKKGEETDDAEEE